MNIIPDIVAKIELFPSHRGGRETPTPNDYLGCPLKIRNSYYDCRIFFGAQGAMLPGEQRRVLIKFLNFDLVKNKLKIGDTFKLWEGKVIGEGELIKFFGNGTSKQ